MITTLHESIISMKINSVLKNIFPIHYQFKKMIIVNKDLVITLKFILLLTALLEFYFIMTNSKFLTSFTLILLMSDIVFHFIRKNNDKHGQL